MLLTFKGIGLLILALGVFSIFSLKAPKGKEAMTGLAGTAIATFLVEAIHNFISGDLLQIAFLKEVGLSSGSMSGAIAAILVSLKMGVNPIFAVVAGAALSGVGIIPGFVAGYIVGFVAPLIEKKLPQGVEVIFGALMIAPLARFIAVMTAPVVNGTLLNIGNVIVNASEQSPIVMGFLLGGMIKVICTSPLSSMALTAMLGLQGPAMGIACIASFGGAFANGIVFKKLKLGDSSNVVAVMLEPLTQADIVTSNPVPIYLSNFLGGGLAGISAVTFGIITNAPGTASPIPGMLAPFAFNDPMKVIPALLFAAVGGSIGGLVGTMIYSYFNRKKEKNTIRKQVILSGVFKTFLR
ncbi:PTS sugar transporter subunit IIC [Alkaliphilus transvaalensis]|uniref:PTS sugar transporter subunit IIC n=1 Tax=Alkaliphilus transvaalensis TaxID=114628 RepID=UPI0006864A5C|nr:PTS sugar transporter subunit IIC [Alkaliphilus transvaalensis]